MQAVQKSERDTQQRREAIDTELEKINATLRDARDTRRRNREEERLLQAIDSLKKHYPGVQGRLVDLCRPTQRRFNLAVTVAGGKDMDAIIVDTKATAHECIKHLREQRAGTATFLPLDSLRVPTPESTERVRASTHRDSRFRLAADVIACDDGMKKAVLYAVENTVICDDLNSARELCFGGGRARRNATETRIKAVTLGGAVISKAGTMTGGLTNDDKSRAGRWDDRELEKLRDRKEELENDRADMDGTATSSKVEELRNNLGNLQNRIQYMKSDLDYTTKQLSEKKTLLKSCEKQLSKMKKHDEDIEGEIESVQVAVQESVEAVKAAEDEHLGPFREATGLRDLQAYEETMGRNREEFSRKKRAVLEHITKLEQQLNYENNRDFSKPIERSQNRLKRRQTDLTAAEDREEALQSEVSKAKSKLSKAAALVKEATDREKEFDHSVAEAQRAFTEAQSKRAGLSKAITSEESALERLRGKLNETLQKARVEEVDLPWMGEKTSKAKRRSNRASRSQTDENDEMEEGDTEGTSTNQTRSAVPTQETMGTTHFSQEDDARVVRDRQQAAKLDFSDMKAHLQQRVSDREERKMRKDFEDKISKIAGDIEGMAPNMKVKNSNHAACLFNFL